MTRGRKHVPSAIRKGKTALTEPKPPSALPRCPDHLCAVARNEWRRLANPLNKIGVLTTADRAAFAAYCQAYARWVEAERKLKETPLLLKTPSGYVQQSPWLSVANKQLEIMGRYMAELGLTPAARRRVDVPPAGVVAPPVMKVVLVAEEPNRSRVEDPRDEVGEIQVTDRFGSD